MKRILLVLFPALISIFAAQAAVPAKPDTILGMSKICPEIERAWYRTSAAEGALSYEWTLPAGVSGSSNVDSVELFFSGQFKGGTLSVRVQNAEGWSEPCFLLLARGVLPSQAGEIRGQVRLCPEEGSATYYTDPIPGATAYEWMLPSGFSGSSSSNSITLDYNAGSSPGFLQVRGVNDCGPGETASLELKFETELQRPGPITGAASLERHGMISLSVPYDPQVQYYEWTGSKGLYLHGWRNTCTVSADAGTPTGDHYIQVTATGKCTERTSESFQIDVVEAAVRHGVWDRRFSGVVGGFVQDVAHFGGALYVCGSELSAGSKYGKLMKWDGFEWDSVSTLVSAGEIKVLEVFEDKLYAGGSFQDAGGLADADHLAWYDGSNWHAVEDKPNAAVDYLLAGHGKLIVSGDFTAAGEKQIPYNAVLMNNALFFPVDTAKMDIQQSLLAESEILSFYAAGYQRDNKSGDLYRMTEITPEGSFKKLEQREYTIKYDTTWYRDSYAYSYRVDDYQYFIVRTDTLIDFSFAMPNYAVNQLLVVGNTVYAAGKWFVSDRGNPVTDSEGLVSFTRRERDIWGSDYVLKWYGVKGECSSISLQDGKLIVVGSFERVQNPGGSMLECPSVAVLDLNTENWSAFDDELKTFENNAVSRVKTLDGVNYLLGSSYLEAFYEKGGSRNLVARINGQWKQLANCGLSGSVSKILSVPGQSKRVLVLGDFSLPNDTNIHDLAYWDEDQGWLPHGTNGSRQVLKSVYAAAYDLDQLYIAARLTDERIVVARMGLSGWEVLGQPDNNVLDMCYKGGLYVAGDFMSIGDVVGTAHIAKWFKDEWTALDQGLPERVSTVVHDGTSLFAGGDFYDLNGDTNFDYVAKWNGTNWVKVSENSRLNYCVYKLAVRNTGGTPELFAGGPFGLRKLTDGYWISYQYKALPQYYPVTDISFNGEIIYLGGHEWAKPAIYRWNGKDWTTFPENLTGEVNAVLFNNGKLYMGGYFGGGDRGTVSSRFGIFYPEDCSFPGAAGELKIIPQKAGSKQICYGDSLFHLAAVSSFLTTEYEWVLPFGASLLGDVNNDTICVRLANNFWGGEFQVYPRNECGYGLPSKLYINAPQKPELYLDPNMQTEFCAGTSGNVLTVYSNCYDNYSWNLPQGFGGSSTSATLVFDIEPTALSGDITLHGECDCGSVDTVIHITVNPAPMPVGDIAGPALVTKGQTVVYRIPFVSNALIYTWTLPEGFSGNSNADSIVVTVGEDALAGLIKVCQLNDCGPGPESTLFVSIGTGGPQGPQGDNPLALWPNPVDDRVYFSSEGKTTVLSLELLNMQGQTLVRWTNARSPLLLPADLPAATYLIRILTSEACYYRKLLKK